MEKRVVGFVLTERITQGSPVLTSDQVTEMLNKENTSEDPKPLASTEENRRLQLDSAAVYTRLLAGTCFYDPHWLTSIKCLCIQPNTNASCCWN